MRATNLRFSESQAPKYLSSCDSTKECQLALVETKSVNGNGQSSWQGLLFASQHVQLFMGETVRPKVAIAMSARDRCWNSQPRVLCYFIAPTSQQSSHGELPTPLQFRQQLNLEHRYSLIVLFSQTDQCSDANSGVIVPTRSYVNAVSPYAHTELQYSNPNPEYIIPTRTVKHQTLPMVTSATKEYC